jgi:hypothetical protein
MNYLRASAALLFSCMNIMLKLQHSSSSEMFRTTLMQCNPHCCKQPHMLMWQEAPLLLLLLTCDISLLLHAQQPTAVTECAAHPLRRT